MLSKMLAGVKTRINCNYLWLTYGSLWEPVFISQDKSSKNLRFILIFFILILTNSERCCISDFIMLNGSGIHLDSYTKPKEICALTNSLLQSRFSLGVLCRVHQGNLLSNPLPQSLMYAQLGGSHLAMLVPPFTAGYSSGELTRLISAFRPVRFRHLLLKS